MIKTECIIKLENIKHIGIVCQKCKTEIKLTLSHNFSGICPSCSSRINPNYINELINCIYSMQTFEGVKSNLPDISFISDEKD